MTSKPEPPIAADVDLSGQRYMPLLLRRLMSSDFYLMSSGDEFKAGLTLWCKAFQEQVPAGSLPNNDRALEQLSGAGKLWPKVRKRALHGWYECHDGRLYHAVLAEVVSDAWSARQANRDKTQAARQSRDKRRHTNGTGSATPPATDPPTFSVTENATSSLTGSKREERREKEEGSSEANASKERSVAIATAPSAPQDAREAMWSEGIPILRKLTGLPEKPCRSFLGKLAKEAEDDCSRVLRALHEAADVRPIDVQPWLLQAVRRPSNPFLALIAEEGIGGEITH